MPIATILIGNDGISGVHKKYNPHDYTALMCRKKMDVRLWNISYLHVCFPLEINNNHVYNFRKFLRNRTMSSCNSF